MARLIDADALPALFDEEYKKTMKLISEGESHLDNLAEGFTEAHQVVLKQPTIEAEPVMHGEWVSLEADIGLFACSNCGHKILRAECNYCPKCGAKMDKKIP